MKYVIIGASAAGINAAKTLRLNDKTCDIVLISKDKEVYSRCMLHHVISGERNSKGISFIEDDFFKTYNIEWLAGQTVLEVVYPSKKVKTNQGEVRYDKLLIATGASSFLPPIKGLAGAQEGVSALRNLDDAYSIRRLSESNKKAIVIGAGLVGLDATLGLLQCGVEVHLMELADRILPLQLDKRSSKTYVKKLQEHGAQVYTNVRVEEVLTENSKVTGVQLQDGRLVDANLLVVAAGVRPNISFLGEDFKSDQRGLIVNAHGETNIKDVYAAGDVCGRAPIWPIAVKQATNTAFNMLNQPKDFDDEFAAINSMNFFNIPTVSIGNPNETEEDHVDVYKKNDNYKKIISRDGLITGAILQGDIAYCGVLTQLIKNKIDIANIDKDIFNIGYGDFFHEDEVGRFTYA